MQVDSSCNAWNRPRWRCDQVGFQRSCGGSEAGVCEACPRGTFKPDDGAHACQDCRGCPAGQFRAGCGGVSAGRCEECGNGTFKGWEGPDEGCTVPAPESRRLCLNPHCCTPDCEPSIMMITFNTRHSTLHTRHSTHNQQRTILRRLVLEPTASCALQNQIVRIRKVAVGVWVSVLLFELRY